MTIGKFNASNFITDVVNTIGVYELKCSVCGYEQTVEEFEKFCPNCMKYLRLGQVTEFVEA